MDNTGKYQNRRRGALLLVILFVMGLAWLGLVGSSWADAKVDWVRRYHGPAGSVNMPTGMALDSQGNIYVTGVSRSNDYSPVIYSSFTTIKYSPKGKKIWVRHYSGPAYSNDWAAAIVVDDQGNVYVTGASGDKYATLKYDTNGMLLWESRHQPSEGKNYPKAMAIDSRGNVYVTGVAYWQYCTIKYDKNGTLLWQSYFSGNENNSPWEPISLAVDGQGRVYVTGGVDYIGGIPACATIKYSPDGRELWARYYKGPGRWGSSMPYRLALDSLSNIYVTGASSGNEYFQTDFVTIKYSPAGKQLWVNRYNGPGNGDDRAEAIALDSQGNIYVTGSSARSPDEYSSDDFAIIKYNSSGECLWVRRHDVPNTHLYWWKDKCIAIDSQDNVYITGKDGNPLTIKYSSAGDLLWMMGYDNHYAGHPVAMAVDGFYNVYVIANERNGSIDVADFITIKYKQTPRKWR